jgi:hypothetical protein
MQDKDGLPLCHFTPFPTPGSAGVNVFSQTLCPSDKLYVFPPFALVLPVLSYLRSQKFKFCTMVVPCDAFLQKMKSKALTKFLPFKSGSNDIVL